jgi:folate-binding protein YgfZ
LSAINISTPAEVFWWRPAAWLRVTGPDAATFLQGQFTNDLRGLEREKAVYGLWLTVKGKVIADSFVMAGGHAGVFWVGSYHSEATAIRERLESHIIADDVVVEDETDKWSAASLFGEGPAFEVNSDIGGFVFPGRRSGDRNLEWVFPAACVAAARAAFTTCRELSLADVERRRILGRVPRVPPDIGPNDLPNEGGLDEAAVSFSKGCYLGQEVMARLKSMGQVRRKLMLVEGGLSELPALPAPVYAAGRRVGELRSAVAGPSGGVVGLAMISLLHVTPGIALSLVPDATPELRVTLPP